MYYYLHERKGYDIRIIGLDLKRMSSVTAMKWAGNMAMTSSTFLEGDIADYEGVRKVDMVVTLHACDTATDFALAKAIGWDEGDPVRSCCQHELNRQMENETLSLSLDMG